MKIAFFVSPYDTLPPESPSILAPWHLAVSLIQTLRARGADVTVFCAEGSAIGEPMVTLGIEPDYQKEDAMDPTAFLEYSLFQEQRLAREMVARANRGAFDLIHVFHGTLRVLPVVSFAGIPVLCTVHDPFNKKRLWMYQAYGSFSNISYVALSQSQQSFGEGLRFAGVVPNGLDPAAFPFEEKTGTSLLMVGRIRPEKGFADGVAASRLAHVPLVIAGKSYPRDVLLWNYWTDQILPQIDGKQVMTLGLQERKKIENLYATARALLFPIAWDEPFGMVMIEAMASGTPVIAYNRGSVSEVIQDGVTGFIVEPEQRNPTNTTNPTNKKMSAWIIKKRGVEGLVEAIGRVGEIDRAACRRHVLEHFTTEAMAQGYEGVYQGVVKDD